MKTSRGGIARITVREAVERTGCGGEDEAACLVDASVLLDVRELDEWSRGHAPVAVHLPLTALSEGVPLPPKAQGRALVVVCRSGSRSQLAVELLAVGGVEAVDVIGGMRQWLAAGLTVVDSQGLSGTVA